MTQKKSSSVLSYVTPWRAISKAATSVAGTSQHLRHTARAMAQSLPGQSLAQDYEEGDVRRIEDSRDRYRAMYALHEWTPEEIAQQLKALRITKMVAFISALIALTAVIALAIKAPVWMSLFLIPISGSVLVLGIAQGFKYALYETQINLSDFISAREFVSREDFWLRLVG